MANIRALIKKHPVLTYFILAFVISWGGILLVIAPVGFPGNIVHRLFPILGVVNEAGPLLAGILSLILVYGRTGFREFRARLLKWRVGAHWYVVALLAAPFLVLPTLFALSLTSSVYLPGIVTTEDKVSLLLLGLLIGFSGAFSEELGWTGFAVPELRRRYSILTTGLIVGLMWGVWHFLISSWSAGDPSSGVLSMSLLFGPLVFYVGVLPAFRVLMVWMYDRTESLPLVILMHGSLSANMLFILSPSARGLSLSLYYLVLTILVWIVVAVVTVASRGRFQRNIASRTR